MKYALACALVALSFVAQPAAAKRIEIKLVNVTVVDASSTRVIDWSRPLPNPVAYTIKKVIKVTFSSPLNLRKFAHDVGATVGASAQICGKEKRFEDNGDDMADYIVDELGQIPDGGGKNYEPERDAEHKRAYSYFAYLSTIAPKSLPGDTSTPYNFFKKIEPICFSIDGGKIWVGNVLESNVLRIGTRVLRRAFARSH